MGRVLSRVFEGVQASPPKCPGSHSKTDIVIHYSKKVLTILEKSSRRDEVRAHEGLSKDTKMTRNMITTEK